MTEMQTQDAGDRGRLDIADRVVEKVATIAATEVDGITKVGQGWERILGRRLPKTDATIAGGRVRINVEIAAVWPTPLADLTARVRDNVSARVSELVGLTVDAVDVTASDVVHRNSQERRVQ